MVNVSTLFVSLLALATSVAALSPQPILAPSHEKRGEPPSPQPPSALNQRSDDVPLSARQIERTTNAERFARGLGPLPPMRRSHLAGRTPQPSGTPGYNLPGRIQVTNAETGDFLGYISKSYKTFGQYGLANKLKDALKVELIAINGGKSGPVQITTKNGDTTFPNLGSTVGYWNTNDALSTSNANYLYIGGTQQTAPGATPQVGGSGVNSASGINKHIESGIWYFKTQTRKITLGWVNPDASVTDAKFVYYPTDGVLFAVGNVNKWSKAYGTAVHVVLTLVDD